MSDTMNEPTRRALHDILALRMMQTYRGNEYLSWPCVPDFEAKFWQQLAEVPGASVIAFGLARELHRMDCEDADEDERRERREPPPKWADPFDPAGGMIRQAKKKLSKAACIIAALAALQ